SLIQLKSSVEREIIKNYLEFNEAKKNVKTLKELMEMAKELYKIAKRRFDTGGLDFLNYRDVEAQALRGEIAYHRGVYQCYLAYYNLLISMGVDLS
ncbi:MAG: TolC family protein, partial [Spirochaetota bacterium]|nr:TolC family protein [Spirochaetota bacterium]